MKAFLPFWIIWRVRGLLRLRALPCIWMIWGIVRGILVRSRLVGMRRSIFRGVLIRFSMIIHKGDMILWRKKLRFKMGMAMSLARSKAIICIPRPCWWILAPISPCLINKIWNRLSRFSTKMEINVLWVSNIKVIMNVQIFKKLKLCSTLEITPSA